MTSLLLTRTPGLLVFKVWLGFKVRDAFELFNLEVRDLIMFVMDLDNKLVAIDGVEVRDLWQRI